MASMGSDVNWPIAALPPNCAAGGRFAPSARDIAANVFGPVRPKNGAIKKARKCAGLSSVCVASMFVWVRILAVRVDMFL